MTEERELHPTLTAEERRRLFRQGIELFNAGRFYDCHESFEEIWRSTAPEPRDLFQGLIQVAVGLHLFLDLGRPAAARRVMARGRRRLAGLLPASNGIALGSLVERTLAWEAWLAEREGEPPAPPSILVFDPQLLR